MLSRDYRKQGEQWWCLNLNSSAFICVICYWTVYTEKEISKYKGKPCIVYTCTHLIQHPSRHKRDTPTHASIFPLDSYCILYSCMGLATINFRGALCPLISMVQPISWDSPAGESYRRSYPVNAGLPKRHGRKLLTATGLVSPQHCS